MYAGDATLATVFSLDELLTVEFFEWLQSIETSIVGSAAKGRRRVGPILPRRNLLCHFLAVATHCVLPAHQRYQSLFGL